MTINNAGGSDKKRKTPRYAVPWRIVVVYKLGGKHETYRGSITDLSLGGASFFSDHNIYSTDPVVVTVEIPAYSHNQKNTIVGARCTILHSILSSNYGKYRIGIKFIDFNGSGKKVLTEALSALTPLADYSSPYKV